MLLISWVGISIHDRERAGLLALDSPLDVFMLRCNAAHPGAERDVIHTSVASSLGARLPQRRGGACLAVLAAGTGR